MTANRPAARVLALGVALALLLFGLARDVGAFVLRAALQRPPREWVVPGLGLFWLLVACVAVAFVARRWVPAWRERGVALGVALVVLAAGWLLWTDGPGDAEVLRTLTPMPPDAVLPEVNARRPPVTYYTNSKGFRGDPWPVRDPARPRVAVLGDSFVFGMGVEADQTLPVLLQRELAATQPGIEVLNLGIPGANLRSYAEVVEPLLDAVAPDVVVLCVSPNDFSGWDPMAAQLASRRRGAYSFVAFLFGDRAAPWLRAAAFGLESSPHDEDRLRSEELSRFSTLVDATGRALLVFAYEAEDLPKLDATGAFAKATSLAEYRPTHFIAGDGHPSAEGNAAFARHLAPRVLQALRQR